LVRQMNAIEANYLNSDFFFDQNKAKIDRQAVSDLRSLALDGAESGKVRQPALWYMTAGYMSLLQGNIDKARTTLAKASEIPNGNANLKNQIRLLANLTELVSEGTLSKEREYGLWQSITWLKSLKEDGHNQTAPRALIILMAQKYLTAGNFDRAVCYLAKADYNFTVDFLLDAASTQDDLVSLERLLAKTGKDPVDAWLTKGFPYSSDDLHYIAGTKYMRKEAFREGLGEYRKIARTFWPAYWGRLKDGREWASFFNDDIYLRTSFGASVPRKSLTRYDKLTFTEKLISLLDQAEKKPQNASTDYYQIANGLSYSPFWGYNDIIWKGTLVESIKFFSPKDYPFNVGKLPGQMEKKYDQFTQEYASYRIPVKYYEKAMHTTKNREVAAKCCFLILQTEKKSNWFIEQEPPRYPEYRGVLSKDYKDTKFYREILKECPVR
ncbi:MAG TPA: hypothetical protein VHR47_11735, partial [Bacillota bacterium]|nr:hypothetical protein [Bacillota bacterium]